MKQTEKQEQAAEILMKRFQPDDENNISSLCFYSVFVFLIRQDDFGNDNRLFSVPVVERTKTVFIFTQVHHLMTTILRYLYFKHFHFLLLYNSTLLQLGSKYCTFYLFDNFSNFADSDYLYKYF